MLCRCTFTATWWRGIQRLWMKVRRPATMTRNIAGDGECTIVLWVLAHHYADVGPPMAGGSCSMTLDGIPSVAAVTPPAGLAPGEESTGVSLKQCWHRYLTFLYFSIFFSQGLKMSLCLPVCSESQGFYHRSVLGPVIIMDPSYSTDLTSASSSVWSLCSRVRPCLSSFVHWTWCFLCLARKSSSELMDTDLHNWMPRSRFLGPPHWPDVGMSDLCDFCRHSK